MLNMNVLIVYTIEGLQDVVRIYALTIFSKSLGFLLHSAIWRKTTSTTTTTTTTTTKRYLEPSIYVMEGFEISSEYVC